MLAVPTYGPGPEVGVITHGGFMAGAPPARSAHAPIGLFDSGVGGLTVAAAIARRMPEERFIYVADQHHVPYGGRPLDEIRSFAGSLSRYMFERGAKLVVMACNVSSATALAEVQAGVGEAHALGVILPGARAAVAATRTGNIGVLATAGTVASGAYVAAAGVLDPAVTVHQVACPAFVPLVESGRAESPEAHDAARGYLAPLVAAGVDTVILGCTHYPFLLPTLRRVAHANLTFVDPAEETARVVEDTLRRGGRAHAGARAPHQLLTTLDPTLFAEQLARLTPELVGEVARVPWAHR
jgi:glutamate racemase